MFDVNCAWVTLIYQLDLDTQTKLLKPSFYFKLVSTLSLGVFCAESLVSWNPYLTDWNHDWKRSTMRKFLLSDCLQILLLTLREFKQSN